MRKAHVILFATLLVLAACASPKPAVSVKKSDPAAPQNQTTVLKSVNRLQHSNAFVTVSFKGLAVLCINEQQYGEVGILKNDHHKLVVEVRKITPKGVSKINFPIDAEHNIRIETINPATKGVATYVNNEVPFDTAVFARMRRRSQDFAQYS